MSAINLLISESNDPFFNLATEEFLLKKETADCILLYVNKPSVVVGKHQNVNKEIDARFNFDNNILIARRLSGGGAVFHDYGNLNFSLIQSYASNTSPSYKILTENIVHFIQSLGIDASLNERNDLVHGDKKLSGSAMHVFKKRFLVHCTLLIDSNLSHLSNSLRGKPDRFIDKSIPSYKSKVINLRSLDGSVTVQDLRNKYVNFLKTTGQTIKLKVLSKIEIENINQMVSDKYSTFDWIYGYSPKYCYNSELTENNQFSVPFLLEVEKGRIIHSTYDKALIKSESISKLFPELNGLKHEFGLLRNTFESKLDPELLNNFLLSAF